jgi:hypothetical protein
MSPATSVVPLAVALGRLLATGVAAATNPSAGLTVGTNGSVAVALTLVDSNGSALRYAMDGNFTPIIDLLPGNASSHASIVAEVELAESSPLLAGLFGNHDGTVEPAEVGMFESLVRSEVGTIPTSAFTGDGILSTTLNGNSPGSAQFGGVSFSGAPGPDSSSAPIAVTTSLTEQYPSTGTSGTLGVDWNLSLGAFAGGLAIPGPNVSVTVTGPPGTTITSVDGFQGPSVSNDPFGYAAPTAAGNLGTTPTGAATVTFQPAFPLGDVLIVVGVGVVAAVGAVLWWRRRRRNSREAADVPRG